ncbi:type-F conjugative transfer system pilin assembly protein TrbC [Sulfuricystis multivorans]|uniref:type-F conjugative transfer system pilin assembly protein TrbC n=1 Tax=Sulfuricystis multivorans TaxID=2211108 RepID=UPI000F83FBE1|nr:type-F conjugative transfer system pilin assembly protein TrbC [Sulfuricystis multivorans]
MTKRQIALALLSIPPAIALAQINPSAQEQDPYLRTQQAIERAMAQAQSMRQNDKQTGHKQGLSVEEVRKMKGVDPLTLANKYEASGVGQGPAKQELMIFISTSMPTKALVMLGEQAKATGAVLVMRGLVAPLGTRGAIQKTMEALQPVGTTGAQIQIDPEAFTRYNVKAVPTFVIASKEEGCSSDTCDSQSYALTGDVTLEYALEQWSSRGGPIGEKADIYLQRLERTRQ